MITPVICTLIRKEVLHFLCHGPFGSLVKLFGSILEVMLLSKKIKHRITMEANYIKIFIKIL